MTVAYRPMDSKRQAFFRGFWKGMASPWVLFSHFELPPEAAPPAFRPLKTRLLDDGQGSDWLKVGDALREAARQHRGTGV